jgi:hypothetical protein
MHFDSAGAVEEIVWMMRQADLPRGSNREIINQLYNGDPPFDPAKAEENNIEINRNDLEGVNLLAHARRQWNTAFLNQENYFSVTLDSGPKPKRAEWGRSITRNINRELKQSRRQLEEKRSTGGQTMLHGIGPCTWDTRKSVIPTSIPIPSLLIPSETDIDFDTNLPHFALFREWTPAKLWNMVKGPRVDPGWNTDLVNEQIRYVADQIQKQPNASAYQYMPERIEELAKQDLGWWGSDAVPTIDVWDFYFQDPEDGNGWYRRTILDWATNSGGYEMKGDKPKTRYNNDKGGQFLYSSGKRKFAASHNEIIHCQFGDCSAVFPQKYHSVRSMGWMLWGVCDLQNRLHCKFNEAVFRELLEFFRTASDQDLRRLKSANFSQYGVIPAGINWVSRKERSAPDWNVIQGAFARNRGLMEDSAAPSTHLFESGPGGKEMREIEVLAKLNQMNALSSGMISLAYSYEEFKYKEQCRRICIKTKPDPIARRIQLGCLRDGVPPELLDADRWRVHADRVLGAGNKTMAMSQVQLMQGIRKNLNPDAQRRVDHISLEVWNDDPALAEELAPVDGQKVVSNSMHDAQLCTERLMRGLPIVPRPEMVYEDYVKVWLSDLQFMIGTVLQSHGMATPEQLTGWITMVKEISGFLKIMAQNDEEKPKVREYGQKLGDAVNEIKAFQQQLMQQAKAAAANGNGAAGPDPKDLAKMQGEELKAKQKVRQMSESHGARTAQRQVAFDLEQQRRDRETNAEIRRENAKAAHELVRNAATDAAEPPQKPFSE